MPHVDETENDNSSEQHEEAKTLEYYMANPGEMPDDENSLMALAEGRDPNEAIDNEPAPTSADQQPQGDKGVSKDEGAQDQAQEKTDQVEQTQTDDKTSETTPPEDEQNAELYAADGKTKIPYSVLKSTRQELNQWKEQAAELQRQIEAQQQQGKDSQPKDQEPTAGQEQDLSGNPEDIDFDALRAEYDEEIVNPLEKALKRVQQLESKFDELSTKEEQREKSEAQIVADRVQEAIDGIPVLAHWQSSDEAMWAAATALDNKLRQTPEFKRASFDERFKEVAKRLNGGSLDVPSAPSTAGQQANQQGAGSGNNSVDDKLKAADNKPPTSLSDLPGGTEPAQNELQQAEGMSETQLAAQMQGWTQEQIDEYLTRQEGA